jgi:cyclic pyranopterin monophosphate synthase
MTVRVNRRRGGPSIDDRAGGPSGPLSATPGEGRSAVDRLTHVGPRGDVRMVDVGDKPVTTREAVATGEITMSAEAVRLIRSGKVKKGDPLQTAIVAGIMAAKQTSSLIPLCHPLPLSHAGVELTPTPDGYRITARVRTSSQTGVEMEALTAVAIAALTIYDMVKAADKTMVISNIALQSKSGGRSGEYVRGGAGVGGASQSRPGMKATSTSRSRPGAKGRSDR